VGHFFMCDLVQFWFSPVSKTLALAHCSRCISTDWPGTLQGGS
jgi:hypothetical protein